MKTPDLTELLAILEFRAAVAPTGDERARARNLAEHLGSYVLPRLEDLNTPLVVAILGSTGSGKSSMFNALAGKHISEVGVLRPTTRVARGLARVGDEVPGPLTRMAEEGFLDVVTDERGKSGLVLVDAPDFDSVEAENRDLARRLLEASDLVIFVTTDTRYADEVPWAVLGRARERGVPLLLVVNLLPEDPADAAAVVGDFTRLLNEGGYEDVGPGGAMQVVAVPRGAVDSSIRGLDRDRIGPVVAVLDDLSADADVRRELARAALNRALGGLSEPLFGVARAMEDEASIAIDLLETRDVIYRDHQKEIGKKIDRGTFLRTEVLREWHDFVGANRVARVISEGVGKAAAAVRAAFNPGPVAPTQAVTESAFEDLIALVVSEADAAAGGTATAWVSGLFGNAALETDPSLWGASPDLEERLQAPLEAWAAGISREISEMGENRRGMAKAASLGVNVVGTGAILAVFVSTGGLTGAEVGIAALTALVNQTLLEAVFGEGNVSRFVESARAKLDELIAAELREEGQRFGEALPVQPDSRQQAARLEAIAAQLAGTPD